MIRAWVHEGDVERLWPKAMKALKVFTNPYTLQYKKKWLVEFATDEQLVEAIRVAVLSTTDVPDEMVAVLAIDGSDASLDALMPYFTAAIASKDRRLDVIKLLRRFKLEKNPSIAAMIQQAATTHDARSTESPALSIARIIGLPSTAGFHFSVSAGSLSQGAIPAVQLGLTVDSREIDWFGVSAFRLSDDQSTRFGAQRLEFDELKLGTATPDQWPSWLAAAAKKLEVTWDPELFISSSVRGAKRDLIARWLLSATAR